MQDINLIIASLERMEARQIRVEDKILDIHTNIGKLAVTAEHQATQIVAIENTQQDCRARCDKQFCTTKATIETINASVEKFKMGLKWLGIIIGGSAGAVSAILGVLEYLHKGVH